MSILLETLPFTLFMLVLLFGSGFCSGSETALFYLSREELRRMQIGSSTERAAAELLKNPERLLSGVLFWNLMINLTYFAVSLVAAKRLLIAGHSSWAGLFSFTSVTLLIIFGEVIPKSLAVAIRYPVALFAAWPLTLGIRLLDPVLKVMTQISSAIQRVMFPGLQAEPYFEAEDLERALEHGEVSQDLAQLEQAVLQRLFNLSEMTVEELMHPRNVLELVESPVHLPEVRELIAGQDYLFLRDPDEEAVVAVVPLAELSHLPERHLEKQAEQVIYVPWCGTIADTLAQLRAKVLGVAVVVNEYGETIGVVTEGDILELMLDPASSRARRLLRRDPIQPTELGTLRVHGLTTLRFLAEYLDIDFDLAEDSLLTVTGMFHEALGRFPVVGDECTWAGYQLKVVEAGARGRELRVEFDPQVRTVVPDSEES